MRLTEPFIGPRPFSEVDAKMFFGRRDELASVAAQVLSSQVVLLYAPSGGGKSSLINAGLIPALRADDFTISRVRLKTLATGEENPVESIQGSILSSATKSSPGQPSLLILDQFEEIVTAFAPSELRALAEAVHHASVQNPQSRFVISFREEYLARVGSLFKDVGDVTLSQFYLERLSWLGAEEAFERSLHAVGCDVGEGATALFLEKLKPSSPPNRSDAGLEPLYLQLLGSELWSSLDHPRTLSTGARGTADRTSVTVTDVDRLIDVDQAIGKFFNSTVARVCREQRVPEKTVRDWVDRELVTADESRSMVRRRVPETEGLRTSVLDDLVRDGLVRTEPRGEDIWLELAHDQLVGRVRELNRIWWAGNIYVYLADRGRRRSLAVEASSGAGSPNPFIAGSSNSDVMRWVSSRTLLWTFTTGIREASIRFSRWSQQWRPWTNDRRRADLDRLSLRAFVLAGTVANTIVAGYRSSLTPRITVKMNAVEGLDPDTAKAQLRATARNLGRTPQYLAITNVVVTVSWMRLLSHLLTRSVVGAAPVGWRRRVAVGLLIGADAGLSLLRWIVRYGVLASCLDGAGEIRRSPSFGRHHKAEAYRCTTLEQVRACSADRPVLLILDWRRKIDTIAEFERLRDTEFPLYDQALRARGAVVTWCSRDDARAANGWRTAVHGIGAPWPGRRTYYMVEDGNVVAWRTLNPHEILPPDNQTSTPALEAARARFVETMTSLIVSSQATPSMWRTNVERILMPSLRRRPSS